jgi:hypothetical protein
MLAILNYDIGRLMGMGINPTLGSARLSEVFIHGKWK